MNQYGYTYVQAAAEVKSGAADERQWPDNSPYYIPMEQEMPRLWEEMQARIEVRRMAEIVDRTVRHYFTDFYYHDLKMMHDHPDRSFAWFVYENGTHLAWLTVADHQEAEGSRAIIQHCLRGGRLGYLVDIGRYPILAPKRISDKVYQHPALLLARIIEDPHGAAL